MQVATLDRKHATYDADSWLAYDALYRGGKAFRALLDKFLPRNPDEPDQVYQARRREAYYRSYAGPIVDYFAAKLYSSPLSIKAKSRTTGEEIKTDPFYASFKEDADGAGTDLIDFMRARFASACVKGRAWWLVELPSYGDRPPANRAEWEERELGRVYLSPLDNEQVFDWEVDERGRLLWVIVYSKEMRRDDPRGDRDTVTETWRLYDREFVETFVASWKLDKQRPKEATSVSREQHGFSRVPLVHVGFIGTKGIRVSLGSRTLGVSPAAVEGLWILNRIAEGQIEHFRLSCARSWNVKRTCYAMPVFKLKSRRPPVMGAGYYVMIDEGEDVTWCAPPTTHLEILGTAISEEKDEIYRVAQQMAAGIDNNAAAIGRSGKSKAVDVGETDVCLHVYGALCKGPIELTLELVTDGRADKDLAWSVEGLDSFNTTDVTTTVDNAVAVMGLNIPSHTLTREVYSRVASQMLPHGTQATMDAIHDELRQNVTAEEFARPKVPPDLDPPPKPDPDRTPPAEPNA